MVSVVKWCCGGVVVVLKTILAVRGSKVDNNTAEVKEKKMEET